MKLYKRQFKWETIDFLNNVCYSGRWYDEESNANTNSEKKAREAQKSYIAAVVKKQERFVEIN